MRFLLYFLMLAGAPALAADPAPDGPADISPAEQANFIAVRHAFLAGDAKKLAMIAQRLQHGPMEVYAAYYQLRLNLANASPQAVGDFLARPDDSAVIDKLRIEWLKMLGKRQQWDLFDAEFPRLAGVDTELTCYDLQSRSRANYLLALRDARQLWFDGTTLPESCGTLFESARSVGIINEADIRQRLRLALENNNVTLAVHLAGLLKERTPALPGELRKAAADPDRYLRSFLADQADSDQRLVALFALHRLAKQNPALSLSRWNRISAQFLETERQYFFGWLGYEAARNLDSRALEWYATAGDSSLNERQLEWRVRAALRALNWPEVLSAINAMDTVQQGNAAWRYWKARALSEAGMTREARNLYAPLSVEHHFYGQLAADELSDSVPGTTAHPAYKPDEPTIAAMLSRPSVQRSLMLYRAGLHGEALDEWRWIVRKLNDHELLTAAEIARRNKMYDRAIGAANLTVSVHDFSLRYLAPYRDALQSHLRDNGLDEAWVFGLMCQESRFATGAKSQVGAAGLMQIMPSTARWVAQRLGLKDYRHTLLHDLDVNLRLGTYYMKTVLSQSENSPVLASAAYNAGPARALQWRGEQPLEGAIYAETIPFEETREYVKKVMSNTVYYAGQFGTPTSLKRRLSVIPPKRPGSR
ncbi:MAG TPA: transglycosylase SLT domain-containing protein [Immundisolibacter sp.]